jgi:cytochrome c
MRNRITTEIPAGNRTAPVALLVLALSAPLAAMAADPEVPDLFSARRCNACHALSEQLIGPPYRAIAVRHSTRADVMIEVLAQKIILGGGGNWGVVPMVPNEHVAPEEARIMAQWILKLDAVGQ